jgi:preprotein translocase subunit SecG
MMGAKQSTDIVEKGTWITAAAVLVFTLVSFIVSPKVTTKGVQKTRSEEAVKGVAPAAMPQQPQQAPAQTPATPAAPVTPAAPAQQ